MSKQVGARTHASAVRAQHTSRVAAAGLAVFLAFGYGAPAQADEGSDVSGVGTADAGDTGTADAGDTGTADAGDDAPPGERAATRSDDAPGRPGKADGTVEISATSSDTDLVTLVVVPADGRRTTTVTPVADAADSLVAGAGQVRRADAAVAVAAAAKEDKPGEDDKPVDPEPGGATEPRTGKPEGAGHQEVVVCHNGRTIVIDSNGLNGHGQDELCAQEPADHPAAGGGQNSSGGDGDNGATAGDASAGDASGTDGTGGDDGADTGSGSGGDGSTDSDTAAGGAGTGNEGDGATAGEQGSTGAEEADGVDETAPRHSEQEDDSPEGSTPKDENGTDEVVALPGKDGTVDGGPGAVQPVVGKPGADQPGAGKPAAGTPADQVKGDEADRSGTEQLVGERPAGSRPGSSPTGATNEAAVATPPDSARLPGQRAGDEILGAAEGSARNRAAALVLPQTGAAESLGIQTGAGLLMVLAGVMTLRGRRRSAG